MKTFMENNELEHGKSVIPVSYSIYLMENFHLEIQDKADHEKYY